MASRSVAKATSTEVGQLYTPAPLEIDGKDVALPRVYIAHVQSGHVQECGVPAGSIYSATGADDPNPEVLWTEGDKEGVLFHVLGLYKGWSIQDGDGELQMWRFDDPLRDPDAWVTYNYTLSLPEIDPGIPYKMLLTKSKASAAKQINTVLMKNTDRGPAYVVAFRMGTLKRQTTKSGKTFTYHVPKIMHVEAKSEHVTTASTLAEMIAGRPDTDIAPARSDEPAI